MQRGAKKFVSSSGGNAGMAVAYAARQYGLPCIVVVPESTPEYMREKIRKEGAEGFQVLSNFNFNFTEMISYRLW